MHHSLRLSNLAKLPPELKARAERACEEEGSYDDLLFVLDETRLLEMKRKTRQRLLPLFNAILYPPNIPTLHELDDEAERESNVTARPLDTRITRVMLALRGLGMLIGDNDVPAGAAFDLWPSMLEWVSFLGQFQHRIFRPHTSIAEQYKTLLSIAGLRKHDEAGPRKLASTSTGWRILVTRAWPVFLETADYVGLWLNTYHLWLDFAKPSTIPEVFLDEYVLGAGGSFADFATILVAHLEYMIPEGDWNELDVTTVGQLLPGVLDVCAKGLAQHEQLSSALIAVGIIPVLTHLCFLLGYQAERLASTDQANASLVLETLISALAKANSRPRLVEALDSGLLDALCLHARAYAGGSTSAAVERTILGLIDNHLLPFIVFRSVLEVLAREIAAVAEWNPEECFRGNSHLLQHWGHFKDLVAKQMSLLEKHIAAAPKRMAVCQHLECGAFKKKRELKRCSRCRSVYYCTKACQRADYRTGSHRADCYTLLAARQELRHEFLTADISFLRTIAEHQWDDLKQRLTQLTIWFAHTHQGSPQHTVLRNANATVDMNVGMPLPLSWYQRPLHNMLYTRAEASNGRLRVLLLLVRHEKPETSTTQDGAPGTACLPMLLRFDGPQFTDGIAEIVKDIPQELQDRETVQAKYAQDADRLLEKIGSYVIY
ncbi:hypothetical protein HMN09_00936800 [Mycena chlorophos]|uniref:MYND-type domain-containing protein n=1 Tax=Mycena chlorophos TaxID=658473 RepID=A0A8H6SJ02_MYCCL|nr:hypothetical protein HMN09_00936800 [Mycena chlorophos]